VLAVVIERPDAWNFPLLLHVLGAMLLVGSLLLASLSLAGAWRSGSPALVKTAYTTLLVGALPSFLLMRLAAEWIYFKEDLDKVKPTPAWVDIGFNTADIGLLLIVIAMTMCGITVRRLRRGATGPTIAARIATGLISLLVAAYVVAIWAMTTKPT
jgi:hypothetical protein